MLKKLSRRIFSLIMFFLTTVIISIIIVFTFLNYRNTINTATMMVERFDNREIRDNTEERNEPIRELPKIDIEGVYYIQIEDENIISNSDESENEQIKEYALKVSKNKTEVGIIGDYVYKVRKTRLNIIDVTLIENEEVIMHTKKIIAVSIIISIFSLIIIYFIAKKVSEFIVKPVEKTIDKQKQFISDASHELKTPLAVIEANVDVLESEVGNNKWMKYIQNEIESMNKLINELLLLAKIENIDSLKAYEQINVSDVIQFTLSMFDGMAYEKNIKVNSKIEENVFMKANKEDIEHILSTLIDNAIKHTAEGKEIEVELVKEKNDIIIQVKNMGEPIPEEEKDKIFERFYRIDKARNRQERRYGLGLAIAKSIVQNYKGNIEVLYKNGFTIFKVNIPN